MVLENKKFEKLSIDQLESMVAPYCDSGFSFMAVTAAEQQAVSAKTGEYVGLWNFHACDAEVEGQIAHPESIPTRIGVPAMSKYSRVTIEELKSFALRVGEVAGKALYARTRVPTQLQTGKGENDLLVGFPFVTGDRDRFLVSLSVYVVLTTMLTSETWKDDVYACMRLGVPLVLPRTLQPYFGPAASYFEVDALELFLESADQMEAAKGSIEYAKQSFQERTYSESNGTLLAFGVSPVATKSSENYNDNGVGAPATQPSASSHKERGHRSPVFVL
ncbi:hypothetical protein OL239_07010 [Arthrobacter sp. ATA002]|uniref:hypothetical protein n=1 Tax=Arthrobacter sp. ATA002 TaxID=2991715 RepID=UPI0022A7CA0C|nr:hypothetical protein [Arthrobacter sp. ATA002]WAP52885.1 hypothetical protein OL239_07010 [Arthrobacter sp. ATA002]